jgi:purine-binding chemotaxis protein CheW
MFSPPPQGTCMNTDMNEIQIACFRLGEDLYAVDIMRIKEIIRPQKLTSLPKSPPFVEGVLNLRGTVIPVIDLRKRFDFPDSSLDRNTRLLIVAVGRQLLGLAVDEVTEVLTLNARDIKPPPQVVNGVSAEYLVGVCLAKDSLIMLLNLDTILTDRESRELSELAVTSK